MKKTLLTIAIVLGIALGASAQNGGLFGKGPQRGDDDYYYTTRGNPMIALPSSHGDTDDVGAPIGTGIAMLIGFGVTYALAKKKKA